MARRRDDLGRPRHGRARRSLLGSHLPSGVDVDAGNRGRTRMAGTASAVAVGYRIHINGPLAVARWQVAGRAVALARLPGGRWPLGYTRPTMSLETETAVAATSARPVRPRIFSGIQPSGSPHLGNDLGAIRNYVRLQAEYEAIYCIVDYHALTSLHDADVLRVRTREMAATLLALGLDPDRCTLFVKSHRPEHTELAWLLATVTPVSWLERTPTYKEKKQNQPEDINHGLLTYPVLQAADIVIYKASLVPVGKDQAAHLELSREIVRRFNTQYGDTFPEPEAVHTEAPVVLGTDGVRKMSKSLGNAIEILAEPEVIRRQVISMVTDTQRILRTDPGRPEVCNVCQLHRFFGDDYEQIWDGERTARTGCVDTKKLLAERIIRHYAPARERYLELMADPVRIDRILDEGAERARPIAQATMDEVRQRMGLR
jgi:tryptophanyl-tRNA synthetase